MRQIKQWLTLSENHERADTLMLILVGHAMEQGWLQDRYKRRAFTLEELTTGMCAALTLEGKPKVIILQQYSEGTSKNKFCTQFRLVHLYSNMKRNELNFSPNKYTHPLSIRLFCFSEFV